jgi:hypothetical protein
MRYRTSFSASAVLNVGLGIDVAEWRRRSEDAGGELLVVNNGHRTVPRYRTTAVITAANGASFEHLPVPFSAGS